MISKYTVFIFLFFMDCVHTADLDFGDDVKNKIFDICLCSEHLDYQHIQSLARVSKYLRNTVLTGKNTRKRTLRAALDEAFEKSPRTIIYAPLYRPEWNHGEDVSTRYGRGVYVDAYASAALALSTNDELACTGNAGAPVINIQCTSILFADGDIRWTNYDSNLVSVNYKRIFLSEFLCDKPRLPYIHIGHGHALQNQFIYGPFFHFTEQLAQSYFYFVKRAWCEVQDGIEVRYYLDARTKKVHIPDIETYLTKLEKPRKVWKRFGE